VALPSVELADDPLLRPQAVDLVVEKRDVHGRDRQAPLAAEAQEALLHLRLGIVERDMGLVEEGARGAGAADPRGRLALPAQLASGDEVQALHLVEGVP
jgi:hypothetical protein